MANIITEIGRALLGGRSSGNASADPIKALEAHQKKIAVQNTESAISKLNADSAAAKSAGIIDTSNKQINAMTAAAKALNY